MGSAPYQELFLENSTGGQDDGTVQNSHAHQFTRVATQHYNFSSAIVTMKNTLLANSSSGGNCFNDGVLSSGHYNLSDDNSCSAYFNQSGDLSNTAAGFDPTGLQNNGGPTKTVMLLSTSPAVDAIPVSPTNYCTLADGTTPVSTDQRGVPARRARPATSVRLSWRRHSPRLPRNLRSPRAGCYPASS